MLPLTPKVNAQKTLKATTLRGFSGGWNVIDDDMNLAYSYSTRARNIYFTSDGVPHVRYGTTLFANCRSLAAGKPVNMEYFNGSIVVVFSDGSVVRVLGDGAANLLGKLWGDTSFVSFTPFNSHLTMDNGSDKPLDLDKNFILEYQQDAGTGTNVNTPIGRYAVACQRYKCIAGDPLEPNRIHISARDAYGTYVGDPQPNDAVRVDVGSILPNSGPIRGLVSFRDKLIVLFAEGVVIGTLGMYNEDGNHTPDFNDAIQQYGGISQRAASSFGDDAYLLDLAGVCSLRRTVLSQQLKPERVSDFVSPEITAALQELSIEAVEDNAFSVYDAKEGQYMLFVPNAAGTESPCYVLSFRPSLKLNAWGEFRDWNWTCGCRSLQGNIFFADADGKLWRYGNRDAPVYTDYVDLVSPIEQGYNSEGTDIAFDWELPWMDFKNRATTKTSRYISFDTRGSGEFNAIMYVDNILSAPALQMGFSGGEQGGFGQGPQPFGGGRNTSYKKQYGWMSKFEIAKLRFTGTANGPLAFVSITMHYAMGGINR